MTRPLDPATAAAFEQDVVSLAVIVYLDILDDPLLAWSGMGDLVFSAGQTGDSGLDGKTFKGTGTIIQLSGISEGAGGSDAVEITMPGVDPLQPMMRQLITNRRRWQFRRAIIWGMALDPETLAIEGKPFRLKTGRMDAMPYSENKGGSVKCKIEGQQAYANSALGTRYSEAVDINPKDVSQKYVHSLANMTASLGQASSPGGASNPNVNLGTGGIGSWKNDLRNA